MMVKKILTILILTSIKKCWTCIPKTILNEEQVPNKFCLWISIEIEMTHNFFFLYAILETALKQNHNYDLHIKTGLPLLGL